MTIASTAKSRDRSRSDGVVLRDERDEPAEVLRLPGTIPRGRMRYSLGVAIGIGTHLLFALVVWQLYRFLHGADKPVSGTGRLWLDLLLAAQFAIPHSILLHPTTRKRLTAVIPSAFYGCFYCVATCCSLLGLFGLWDSDGRVVWAATGAARTAVQTCFIGSWAALFYGLSLTGLGYQTGFTPWWRWVRGLPVANRPFHPRGAYLWLRHPVYLSFLGLIWLNPLMTVDRLLLAVTWTVYIAVGSWLKDRRLEFYLGDIYRVYAAKVPGYWGMPIGPLARIPLRPTLGSVSEPPTDDAIAAQPPLHKAA